jgi:hypothetical protein
MKYYCENCGTEYSITRETEAALESYRKDCELKPGKPIDGQFRCPICLKPLDTIPDRETVAAWEKRKECAYLVGAPAYIFMPDIGWCLTAWGSFMEIYYGADNSIIATEAGAPPDDWRTDLQGTISSDGIENLATELMKKHGTSAYDRLESRRNGVKK